MADHKILVAVDLSHGDRLVAPHLNAAAKTVVDQAVEFAAQSGADVTFFTSLDLSPYTLGVMEDHPEQKVEVEALANQALQKLVAQARAQGVAGHVDAKFVYGKSWVEVIKEAQAQPYTMLVAGTRGLKGIEGFLLGSTGSKLVRNAPCPVWVARPHVPGKVRKVLVATDLKPIGDELVRMGAQVAAAQNGELHIVHALEYPWDSTLESDPRKDAYRQRTRQSATDQLEALVKLPEVAKLSIPAKIHLKEELAEDAILNLIKSEQIDLLVMATVSHSGIVGLLLGNTAERLLPQIPCSLLTIKPVGFQSPIT